MTGWTGQNPPYNGYIGMDANYNIAHYGCKFADGNRMGHWDVITEGTVASEGATIPVIAQRQSYNGQTRYLTANEAGDMRVMSVPVGALTDDQRFVITGHEYAAFLQRKTDFNKNTGKGHVQGHGVAVDGQSNVDAKANASTRTPWRVGIIP